MHITLVAGARPNFMKIAPMMHAMKNEASKGADISYQLVHTGQHYDKKLSEQFFDELNIPKPDANLEVGSGSHADQTANIMIKFEEFLLANPTDVVLVVGDVNSTVAAALVAKKLGIIVVHVEGGIRSFDRSMPEEINRLATDSITDYFMTTSRVANQNLLKEGVKEEQLFFVGNTMIDTLLVNKARFERNDVFDTYNVKEGDYIVTTLHRPSNVDDATNLHHLLNEISKAAGDKKVLFPCHPRTKHKLDGLSEIPQNIIVLDPMGYLYFGYMLEHAYAVVTDSGGIQEETTVLGIPCMTLRDNTERPETCEVGTNVLIGTDPSKLAGHFKLLDEGKWKQGGVPELWDGKTSERITEALLHLKR